MFEDTKGVKNQNNSKDRQYNCRMKKERKDKQWLTNTTKKPRTVPTIRSWTRLLWVCKQFLLHYWHPKHKSIKKTTFWFIFYHYTCKANLFYFATNYLYCDFCDFDEDCILLQVYHQTTNVSWSKFFSWTLSLYKLLISQKKKENLVNWMSK